MQVNNISNLRTGDIFLFSGKGWVSNIIKLFTFSNVSHVGMVIVDTQKYSEPMLWESTTLSNLKDYESGKPKAGVQLVSVRERIATYNGTITLRRLRNVAFSQNEMQAFNTFYQQVKNHGYEASKWELAASAMPIGNQSEDLSTIFCSELVAEGYQQLGMLPHNVPSNNYTPKDFTEQVNLKLLKGTLGAEELVKGYVVEPNLDDDLSIYQ